MPAMRYRILFLRRRRQAIGNPAKLAVMLRKFRCLQHLSGFILAVQADGSQIPCHHLQVIYRQPSDQLFGMFELSLHQRVHVLTFSSEDWAKTMQKQLAVSATAIASNSVAVFLGAGKRQVVWLGFLRGVLNHGGLCHIPAPDCSFSPLENLTDPRIERTRRQELFDLVVVALCETIARADTWNDIERFGRERLD